MGKYRICYSELASLDIGQFLDYVEGAFNVNEIRTNQRLCAAGNGGAEYQRLIPYGVWGPRPEGIKSQFSPYQLKGDKFDLSKFNAYYWPIVKQILIIAKKYGLTTWWALADNCQFHGSYRKYSPWVTNINGVTSIYDGAEETKYDEDGKPYTVLTGSYPFFKAFIEKSLAELGPLGAKWAWGNEMNNPGFRALANAVIFPFLKAGKIEPEDSTYGATMDDASYDPATKEYTHTGGVQDLVKKDTGDDLGEAAKLAVWREVHGCGGKGYPQAPNPLDQALTWWARLHDNGIRIWLSDDGVWDGDSPCDFETETGHRRPSGPRWAEMIKRALTYKNQFIFEHLPKGGDPACQQKILAAIFKALYAVEPEEKYHYEPPPPTETRIVCIDSLRRPTPYCLRTKTIQVPVGSQDPGLCDIHTSPPPPESKSCFDKYIAGRPISKWQIRRFIACLFGRD
jgi:hypothetical protein